MKCVECGQDRRPTSEERQALWDADLYDAFVAENASALVALSEFLADRIIENDPENPHCRYDWPESEAVAILESWEDLKALIEGPAPRPRPPKIFREYR